MNKFVLDASVALSWYFRDEQSEYGKAVLFGMQAAHALVPPLWIPIATADEALRRAADIERIPVYLST